jgi:DNA-binding NarL/FixJ family response regulator
MQSRRSPIRVLLVEDHEIVRRALRELLSLGGEIDVVGEARTAMDALSEAIRLEPGVVLLDLRLPDGSGIDVCSRIRESVPEAQVLILTSHDDATARDAAVTAGAAGYLLKDLDPSGLRQAILDIADGHHWTV